MESKPLYDMDAEKCLLGTLLIDDKIFPEISSDLEADDFSDRHAEVWGVCLKVQDDGESVNLFTVTAKMREKSAYKGNAAYLTLITDIIPFSGNIKFYIKQIKSKSTFRAMAKVAGNIAAEVGRQSVPAGDLLDYAEQAVYGISAGRDSGGGFSNCGEIVMESFDRTEELCKMGGGVTGVPSGFADLDRMTSGFQRSDLVILAARPSVGKTSLGMNIASNAGVPTAVFSLEMSKVQIGGRLLSGVGRVNSMSMRNGSVSDTDIGRLAKAVGVASAFPIFVDDTPSLTVSEIRSRARRLQRKENIELIVIDYMQLIRGSGKNFGNATAVMTEISSGLKAMAKELDVPVIALSQLNRSLESRTDKRPIMSDLRDSGSIEQDADVIIFIYRDEVHNKADDNPAKGTAEVIIAKQRTGPTGTVMLGWMPEYCVFVNLAGEGRYV